MPQLQIRLFGGFQVHLDEHPIRFPTQKVRALLAYLSVEAKSAHSREKLMTLFWPEQSQNSASNNLRQTLSRLRSAQPADTLLIRDNEIQFNLKSNHRVDVTAFVQAFSAKMLDDVAAASELYQGDFLAHFSLPDSPMFEEWALLKREWLRREALKMLHHLTLAYEQAERHEDAISAARRQVEIDSLHEVAWQQLMRNLALAGRRSEAIDQFEHCRQILEKELEVEPAQETTQLAQQIRAGGFAPKSIGQPSQLASFNETIAPTRLFNIPTPLTPLVGREVELAHLAELLAEPSTRLLTILGPGGMGKTHLALEAAYRLCLQSPDQARRLFPDGVYWVALAAIPSGDRLIETLANTLTIGLSGYQEPLQQVQTWLRTKHLLLLLDNFEHMLEGGVERVVELLRAAPHLKIVITSRLRLQLQSEQLFPLEGLNYPGEALLRQPQLPSTLAVDWLRYEAIQLFVQQAQRVDPQLVIPAADLQAIAAICRLLQGMPLAILLAAGWVGEMTLSKIAAQVQSSIDFLSQEWRDLPIRQQSMRAVLNHSWQLLSERERQILQTASLFRAGFSEDAAQKVLQATQRDLVLLVGKSMIERTDNGRYVLHELLRQYAAEKLGQTTDQGATVRYTYTKYFVEQLAVPGTEYDKPEQIKPFLLELENVHVAWQQVLQLNEVEWALQTSRLYLYIAMSYVSLSYLHELTQQFSNYLERVIEEQPHFYPAQRKLAWILINQATYSVHMGQHDKTAALFRRSHELFKGPAYSTEESLHNQAMAWSEEARVSVHYQPLYARQLYLRAMPIFEQFSDDFWLIGTRTLLANLDFHLGLYQQAEQSFRVVLAYEEQQGKLDPFSPTGLIKLIGLSLTRQGAFHDALSLLREDLSFAEKNTSHTLIADALPFLATTLFWFGEISEAQRLISQKLTVYAEAAVPGRNADAQRTQATIYLHTGDYTQASNYCLQAIEIQRMTRDSFALGESLVILAQIRLGEQQLVDAQAALVECIDLYQSLGEHGVIGSAYATLAYLLLQQGQATAAEQQVYNALQIAHEWRAFFAGLYALPVLALLKMERGDSQQAVKLYRLVSAQTPIVAKSRWFAQMAGDKISAYQTNLPPKQIGQSPSDGDEFWDVIHQLHETWQAESPSAATKP